MVTAGYCAVLRKAVAPGSVRINVDEENNYEKAKNTITDFSWKGGSMIIRKNWLALLIIVIFFTSGCAAAVVGGAAVGAGSGTYFYVNGELKTDYYYSFEKVWSACEKTVADMRGLDVEPVKEIGSGKITAMIENEKVQITANYKAKDATTVSVRVGVMGDKLASQLLHDKIADNLTRKR
jgi:hypothetical protein